MSAHDALDHGRSGLLSDAALSALQLHHQPFTTELEDAVGDDSDEASANGLFSDSVTDEQLADIKQALITGDDLLLILGEKGAGKSTLLKQLNSNSGLRIQCFPITGSQRFSTFNLFTGMLEAFPSQNALPDTLKGVLDELIPCLQSMVGRNTLSVIVLDDAHLINQSELTQLLSGMLYMNSQDETLMRVALSATGEFEDLIPDLLPEGADLPYSSLTIEGFSPQRAASYLQHRLHLAGFDQEFPFTDRDMASLVDHSAGRPAELHTLTADVLNEKYGRFDDVVASELTTEKSAGFLQSRPGKLALGALATVLIIGGMLMFMPAQDINEPPPIREPLAVAPQIEAPQVPAPTREAVTATQNGTAEIPDEQAVVDQAAQALNNASSDMPTTIVDRSDQASSELADTTQGGTANTTAGQTQSDTPAPIDTTESAATANSGTEQVITTVNNNSATTDITATDNNANTPEPEPAVIESNEPLIPQNNTVDETDAPVAAQDNALPESGEADVANAETRPDNETAVTLNNGLDDDLAGALESPTWILVQDESLYTIQMSASTELESVKNFLRRNPLPAPNSVFSFERNGEIWYALVHGVFQTVAEAQSAVEQMSAEAQRDQPWIRSIARIKGIYREE